MAEPLKNIYDGTFIEDFGQKLQSAWPAFDKAGFAASVKEADWELLELKGRIRRITEALGAFLPADYEEALGVLFLVDEVCTGFPYLFFPDYVEVFGRGDEHWQFSMEALARFTARSSAEFAVRPFILANPKRMLPQLMSWAEDSNEHVRRLASEGSRPRLPWGQALPLFKKDPAPLLPLLEKLKKDPSLYVRKSVANHLNDIAKDHPQLVIETAERWKGTHPHTDWIVRHACRSLIKQSEPKVMALFGYAAHSNTPGDASLVSDASIELDRDVLRIGEEVRLHYRLKVTERKEERQVKLRVEYGIDFVKANGKTSLKRFLLSDRLYAGGETLDGLRVHSFANLTTRKHYSGKHELTLWVNGKEAARTSLTLLEEQE
ncbi:DNA alkylation repair protein [Paenibacillus sp. HB172176]|uniref:DNA alkylation repair protein n=1 Tax=Paenibacillus sp. HB172176 TaxID=2493690 RepID=UPI00143B3393|nr:DNA alkylation repair protein [Paenibacillus sp. HB172176]